MTGSPLTTIRDQDEFRRTHGWYPQPCRMFPQTKDKPEIR